MGGRETYKGKQEEWRGVKSISLNDYAPGDMLKLITLNKNNIHIILTTPLIEFQKGQFSGYTINRDIFITVSPLFQACTIPGFQS